MLDTTNFCTCFTFFTVFGRERAGDIYVGQYYTKSFNNWFIRQRAFIEIRSTREVWRARKMRKSCSRRKKIFFLRDLFADVMSVHNRNMKHARAIEFE